METTPFPDSLDNSKDGDDHVEKHVADNNLGLSEYDRTVPGSFLSKVPMLRTKAAQDDETIDKTRLSPESTPGDSRVLPKTPNRAMAVAIQQQKTRRRKGSLRKAALLGRGAQRDKKEIRTSHLENGHRGYDVDRPLDLSPDEESVPAFGLGISDATRRPIDEHHGQATEVLSPIATHPMDPSYHLSTFPAQATSPTLTYTSTTDEDDILSIPSHSSASIRAGSQTSAGPGAYFPAGFVSRHRSFPKPKSPLSIGGLAASPLPVSDGEWDYSETEWWGWVVLIVTWIVFVTGMGSCLGVWSWAWDVGETPYAPPELEDDPTLPIVGYYPALIILTAVMAWVWVVVAWVGMKYFRHAKISGD